MCLQISIRDFSFYLSCRFDTVHHHIEESQQDIQRMITSTNNKQPVTLKISKVHQKEIL